MEQVCFSFLWHPGCCSSEGQPVFSPKISYLPPALSKVSYCFLPYPWRKECLLSGVSLFAFHKWIIARKSLLRLYHQLWLAGRLADSGIFLSIASLHSSSTRRLSKFTNTVQMRTLLTFKHEPPWRDFFGRIVFCQSVWQLACFRNNDIFSPQD